jgi:hypothetical protein
MGGERFALRVSPNRRGRNMTDGEIKKVKRVSALISPQDSARAEESVHV